VLRNVFIFYLLVLSPTLWAQSLGDQLGELVRQGATLRDEGKLKAAEILLDSALNIAIENNQNYHRANLSYHLGLTYMQKRDDTLGKALMNNAHHIFRSLDGRFNHMAASVLMNAGDLKREQGNINEAKGYVTQAITYLEQNLVKKRDSIMLVNLWNRLSDIYRVTGDFDEAKQIIYQAPYWPGVSYSTYYSNLANAFNDEGLYLDSAKIYYQMQLERELARGDRPKALADAQMNLARFYIDRDSLPKAEKLLFASLKNYRLQNDSDTVYALVYLSKLTLMRNEFATTAEYLAQTDAAINQFTDEELLEKYYQIKRDYSAMLNSEDYYIYLAKADSLSDKKFKQDRLRILALDNDLKTAALELQNETEKNRSFRARAFNVLLVVGLFISFVLLYYFVVLSRNMRRLSARNELLVREQNHRVKNNLQMINSLLSLQAGRLKDEQSKAVLEKSQSRIQAISILNRSLYEQKDISQVELSSYLKELSHDVINSVTDQSVEGQLNLEAMEIGVDQATSLGLIINELIVNTIKHSVVAPGFDLTIVRRENRLELSYVDHAKGFSLRRYEQSRSFGRRLIDLQSRQLKAKAEVVDSDQFEFKLVFSL
jgi:two-component sensor histidine kinase